MLSAHLATTHPRPVQVPGTSRRWSGHWWMMYVLIVLMVGLRHEVGADWPNYVEHIEKVTGSTLVEAMAQSDPAYGFLNWVGSHWGGIYVVNFICAVLFSWGLVAFCRVQPYPWLALTVAVPYLVIVVAMGYNRQGVAIGLAMMGFVALGRGRLLLFVFWIGVAALFHKTAVILVPLAILSGTRGRLWTIILVGVAGILMFVLLLQESIEILNTNYLDIQSSGAAVRVAMNALPALAFLFLRQRFLLSREQQSFWTWMSLSAIAFVLLLIVSPSSTAVDRLALYWIPLQLFVWSRVPDILRLPGRRRLPWIYTVCAYSATVQLIWLVFADNSSGWLPYQFYPWAALWQ